MKLTLITLNHCFINIEECTHIYINNKYDEYRNYWSETQLFVGDNIVISVEGEKYEYYDTFDKKQIGKERDKMMHKILKYICDEIFKKHYVIDIRKLEKQLYKIGEKK